MDVRLSRFLDFNAIFWQKWPSNKLRPSLVLTPPLKPWISH